jgi:release factor glutamine methyltransferase
MSIKQNCLRQWGIVKTVLSLIAALQAATSSLISHSDSPTLDAELLLASVLKISRAALIARSEQLLTAEQQKTFDVLIARRQQGEPIAYLLGHREFWSLDLIVTSDTLIPRPETELLVEKVLALLPADFPQKIADLGTGSGAIALAIAHERPHWSLYATDQSAAALAVAKQNAERLNISNVNFFCGDWFRALPHQQFNAIISNPPYIATNDPHLQKADLRFEPKSALVSGDDGLSDIRQLIAEAKNYLQKGGWLFLEHGFDQAVHVREQLQAAGYQDVQTDFDLAGHPRVTLGRIL